MQMVPIAVWISSSHAQNKGILNLLYSFLSKDLDVNIKDETLAINYPSDAQPFLLAGQIGIFQSFRGPDPPPPIFPSCELNIILEPHHLQ